MESELHGTKDALRDMRRDVQQNPVLRQDVPIVPEMQLGVGSNRVEANVPLPHPHDGQRPAIPAAGAPVVPLPPAAPAALPLPAPLFPAPPPPPPPPHELRVPTNMTGPVSKRPEPFDVPYLKGEAPLIWTPFSWFEYGCSNVCALLLLAMGMFWGYEHQVPGFDVFLFHYMGCFLMTINIVVLPYYMWRSIHRFFFFDMFGESWDSEFTVSFADFNDETDFRKAFHHSKDLQAHLHAQYWTAVVDHWEPYPSAYRIAKGLFLRDGSFTSIDLMAIAAGKLQYIKTEFMTVEIETFVELIGPRVSHLMQTPSDFLEQARKYCLSYSHVAIDRSLLLRDEGDVVENTKQIALLRVLARKRKAETLFSRVPIQGSAVGNGQALRQ